MPVHHAASVNGPSAKPVSATLSRSVAHEINNPLDSLLNLLCLLEAEPSLSANGRHYLSLAREEVRRISQIARENLEGSESSVAPQSTDVPKLLADVLDFYQQRFSASGISVSFRHRHNGAGRIPTYTEQLRRVFANLLLNAAEAMPEGGKIQARVSAAKEWSGRKRRGIKVTVADNGAGIEQSALRRIFQQPFTTKPAGHGVGLTFVKKIVGKHKGRVQVRSSTRLGRHGTVFTLFLPAAS